MVAPASPKQGHRGESYAKMLLEQEGQTMHLDTGDHQNSAPEQQAKNRAALRIRTTCSCCGASRWVKDDTQARGLIRRSSPRCRAPHAAPLLQWGSCPDCGLDNPAAPPGCARTGSGPPLPTLLAPATWSLPGREGGCTPREPLRPRTLGASRPPAAGSSA